MHTKKVQKERGRKPALFLLHFLFFNAFRGELFHFEDKAFEVFAFGMVDVDGVIRRLV